MKVLIIANGDFFSDYGGGQVYVRNEVNEMIRQGRNIAVVSFRNGIPAIGYQVYRGAQLYELPPDNEPLLKELIARIAPALIHVHACKATTVRIARALHIPVVVTAHHGGIVCPAGALLNDRDMLCHCPATHRNCLPCVLHNMPGGHLWAGLLKMLPEQLLIKAGHRIARLPAIPVVTPVATSASMIAAHRTAWKHIIVGADYVISPSVAMGKAMLRNGLPQRKLVILPHGIPLAVAPPPTGNGGLPQFCYVGRICHEKGLHVLLRAFEALPPACRLFVAGDSANRAEDRYHHRLRRIYKDDHRIHWLGKLSPFQVQELLACTDVLVHPTICLEVFGLNIAAALAAGRPVVATRCGGAEMQIVDGITGWLVPPNDAQLLRAAMMALCNNPVLAAAAGRLAGTGVTCIRDHVEDLYTRVFNHLTHTV